jgi:hypothetical protein
LRSSRRRVGVIGTRRSPERLFGATKPAWRSQFAPDVDEVAGQVDVIPLQRLQFAQPQSRVESGGVDRPIVRLQGVEERADFCRGGDPFVLASNSGKSQPLGRVDRDVAAAVCAPEDRT